MPLPRSKQAPMSQGSAGQAQQQGPIAFMNIPDIPGEVRQANYEDQIAIYSLDFEAVLSANNAAGASRVSGRPSVSEFTIIKELDKSSPLLFDYLTKHRRINDMVITFTKSVQGGAAGGEVMEYLVYVLTDVLVTYYSPLPNEQVGDNKEEVRFIANQIEMTYTQEKDGSAAGQTAIIYHADAQA